MAKGLGRPARKTCIPLGPVAPLSGGLVPTPASCRALCRPQSTATSPMALGDFGGQRALPGGKTVGDSPPTLSVAPFPWGEGWTQQGAGMGPEVRAVRARPPREDAGLSRRWELLSRGGPGPRACKDPKKALAVFPLGEQVWVWLGPCLQELLPISAMDLVSPPAPQLSASKLAYVPVTTPGLTEGPSPGHLDCDWPCPQCNLTRLILWPPLYR